MDERVKLKVQGLMNSQIQSGAYALILSEESGVRRLPIIVGTPEAQSIAIALENIQPPRPLTHDLLVNFSKAYQVRLREVFISRFQDGIFYAEMLFFDGVNKVRIDARTSDAIAVALRMKCEIYTLESIMRKCGIVFEDKGSVEKKEMVTSKNINLSEIESSTKLKEWLHILQRSEIEERMDKAIEDENYEFAKIYKEELLRREKEGDNQ